MLLLTTILGKFSALALPAKVLTGSAIGIGTFGITSVTTNDTYMSTNQEPIPFSVEYIEDETKPMGSIQEISPGINGTKELTYKIHKVNGIIVSTENTDSKVLKKPVNSKAAKGILKITDVVENQTIPFTTETKYDSTIDSGSSVVQQQGTDGMIRKIYRVTSLREVDQSKNLIEENILTQPTPKIVVVGTKKQSVCEAGYSPCVPIVSYDLDCPDIGFSVRVTGSDPHRFDRDNDGYGCESY